MSAFKGAVDVGAHAIETDLQLTKDGVVVISHVRFLTFKKNGCQSG
jgi:glycerophosphoryl diester phosphodiesterase